MYDLTPILRKLEHCLRDKVFESTETDWLEIKPVPATGNAWDTISESICALLNSRGGVVILGIKEEQKPQRHYVFTGYSEQNSGNVAALRKHFTDDHRSQIDVSEWLLLEVIPFSDGQIAVIRVSPLPEDRKYCFYRSVAFQRVLDRDERIPQERVDEQKERKQEMEASRELRPVDGVTLNDLDLQRINELVLLINQGQARPIETIKTSTEDAVPFLEKKRFMLRDGRLTTLGVLVCGAHPEEHLLFRSQLDAFVDIPNAIAQDKKTVRSNILQLMEEGYRWTLRNIQTGVAPDAGGTMVAEYSDRLIRESINNALAHRDYSINRPVQITIRPRESISIRNPGCLPAELVFEKPDHPIPVRRIFASPRARNPRLADILKIRNKWEGKGIGMSDLVNFALDNEIDLPFYLFHSAEELSLCIPSGKLLDEATESWLELMNGLIARKAGHTLSHEERMVLAYLIKSERANRIGRYTLALTPSNNHFGAIASLSQSGLIALHEASDRFKEVYIVCRELMSDNAESELGSLFGKDFLHLDVLGQQCLTMVLFAEKYSQEGGLNAKQVMRLLRTRLPVEYSKRGEDEFYRAIRYRIERNSPVKDSLNGTDGIQWRYDPTKMLGIRGPASRPLYRLNPNYQIGMF
jgi:predicted HTH transcriptional regulator